MHATAKSAPLELGLIVSLGERVEDSLRAVADVGLRTCQLSCWRPDLMTPAFAATARAAADRAGIEISSLWAGHSGETRWNFTDGPRTIGLVPAATRAQRVQEYLRAADFARALGTPSMTTHLGFIPEDLHHPDYAGTVVAVRTIAERCAGHGIGFWFETGQETPITLKRLIDDVGLANLGVNLDPANLILYGKGNPVDALDVLGAHIRGVHAKDGVYPTSGKELGHETAIGRGKVDFPALMGGLKKLGFTGRVTIEREISGPQQKADILAAIAVLTPLL